MCALDHPGLFGGVISEGGDFSRGFGASAIEEGETVAARLAGSPRSALRFWLLAGALDGEPAVGSSRHLRDVLRAKGYACDYTAPVVNHNTTVWLGALARGLEVLLAR